MRLVLLKETGFRHLTEMSARRESSLNHTRVRSRKLPAIMVDREISIQEATERKNLKWNRPLVDFYEPEKGVIPKNWKRFVVGVAHTPLCKSRHFFLKNAKVFSLGSMESTSL